MSSLNVLSLDLDWFNIFADDLLTSSIKTVFDTIFNECQMPDQVFILEEHHYMYPLLERISSGSHTITNIDLHHDFYFMREIRNFQKTEVTCGNFFAFMVHQGLLREYQWVTGYFDHRKRSLGYGALRRELASSKSKAVRLFRDKVFVHSPEEISSVLRGKRFDTFVVIRSPDYTTRSDTVSKCVNYILSKKFHGDVNAIRRNKCKAKFIRSARQRINLQQLLVT